MFAVVSEHSITIPQLKQWAAEAGEPTTDSGEIHLIGIPPSLSNEEAEACLKAGHMGIARWLEDWRKNRKLMEDYARMGEALQEIANLSDRPEPTWREQRMGELAKQALGR